MGTQEIPKLSEDAELFANAQFQTDRQDDDGDTRMVFETSGDAEVGLRFIQDIEGDEMVDIPEIQINFGDGGIGLMVDSGDLEMLSEFFDECSEFVNKHADTPGDL